MAELLVISQDSPGKVLDPPAKVLGVPCGYGVSNPAQSEDGQSERGHLLRATIHKLQPASVASTQLETRDNYECL